MGHQQAAHPVPVTRIHRAVAEDLRLWAEKLYIIGTIGMVPQPVVAKNNLGNVVKQFPLSAGWSGDLNNEVQQLFWKS